MIKSLKYSKTFTLVFLLFLSLALKAESKSLDILPRPQMVKLNKGQLRLPSTWTYSSNSKIYKRALRSLKDATSPSYRFKSKRGSAFLNLRLSKKDMPKEAYFLKISSNGIHIEASSSSGLFYGVQSLIQILPTNPKTADKIPYCEINDQPRFKKRGMILDSGRQYQTVKFIKQFIDGLARLKMNTFHWHLNDYSGWRLEIKKYPKLTKIGANMTAWPYPEQKGFYTQKEVRSIIKYTAARHINIIPEIDVPGHSFAAIMAMPELSCAGKHPAQNTIPEARRSHIIFCPVKSRQFFKDVFSEVCQLFPNQEIHIGGDEVRYSEWQKCSDCKEERIKYKLPNPQAQQHKLENELASLLESKGKTAVMWSDLYVHHQKALHKNITISWWNYRARKHKAVQKAMKEKRPFILSPNAFTYLNFPITPWRGYKKDRTFGLKTAYLSNTIDPILAKYSAEEQKLCQGLIGALWTDYGLTQDMLSERLFPRVFAISELAWHTGQKTDYQSFKKLVYTQEKHYQKLGWKFGRAEATD